MFKKVIAVDVNKGLIEIAAKTLGELEQENVVFLMMDLMADGWSKFASNDVKVVVIDADHTYAGVKRDAGNALRYLPEVQWLVFHDIWMDPVALAVHEFEQQGLLKCT
jgi:predicted methyltransferase